MKTTALLLFTDRQRVNSKLKKAHADTIPTIYGKNFKSRLLTVLK